MTTLNPTVPNFDSSLRHTPTSSSDYAVAIAADILHEALRPIRKAALVQDVKFEKMSVRQAAPDGDIHDGTILFGMKISASTPPHRKSIWVPVLVRDGFVQAPTAFRDSTDREYALTQESIEKFMGIRMTDFRQLKRMPRIPLALTDRTVLPTLPARNFFSLANRKTGHYSKGEMVMIAWDTPEYEAGAVGEIVKDYGDGRYGVALPGGMYAEVVSSDLLSVDDPAYAKRQGRIMTRQEIIDYGNQAFLTEEESLSPDDFPETPGGMPEEMQPNGFTTEQEAEPEIDDESMELLEDYHEHGENRLGAFQSDHDDDDPDYNLVEADAQAPTFDAVNDQSEERWIQHEDPTTSSRTAAQTVVDVEGNPIQVGSVVTNGVWNGTVLDVFDDPDGNVYVNWEGFGKSVEWGNEMRLVAARTAQQPWNEHPYEPPVRHEYESTMDEDSLEFLNRPIEVGEEQYRLVDSDRKTGFGLTAEFQYEPGDKVRWRFGDDHGIGEILDIDPDKDIADWGEVKVLWPDGFEGVTDVVNLIPVEPGETMAYGKRVAARDSEGEEIAVGDIVIHLQPGGMQNSGEMEVVDVDSRFVTVNLPAEGGGQLNDLGETFMIMRKAANALDGGMTLEVGGEEVGPEDLTGWALYEKTEPTPMVQMEDDFTVDTMEGAMNADAGDFLAVGPEGEMYPVDGDIQEQTYEQVSE